MLTGIRGAISVEANTRDAIFAATRHLLDRIIEANQIREEDVAGLFFTATPDLDAGFPAYAVRDMGWRHTASLCAHEMSVPGAMEKVIRVMMFVNNKDRQHVQHQYIGRARALRPDLAEEDAS